MQSLIKLGSLKHKYNYLILVILLSINKCAFADSRADRVQMDLNTLRVAVLAYESHCQEYPNTFDALLVSSAGCINWRGPYLSKSANMTDPWGSQYKYFNSHIDKVFFLLSIGKDSVIGTQDDVVVVGAKR